MNVFPTMHSYLSHGVQKAEGDPHAPYLELQEVPLHAAAACACSCCVCVQPLLVCVAHALVGQARQALEERMHK